MRYGKFRAQKKQAISLCNPKQEFEIILMHATINYFQ